MTSVPTSCKLLTFLPFWVQSNFLLFYLSLLSVWIFPTRHLCERRSKDFFKRNFGKKNLHVSHETDFNLKMATAISRCRFYHETACNFATRGINTVSPLKIQEMHKRLMLVYLSTPLFTVLTSIFEVQTRIIFTELL